MLHYQEHRSSNRVVILNVYISCSHRVLHLSSGIDDMGMPHWDLVLALLGAWLIAFSCMIKGIKSSGKVGCWNILQIFFSVLMIVIFQSLKVNSSIGNSKLHSFYLNPFTRFVGCLFYRSLPICCAGDIVLPWCHARWCWWRN